MKAKIGLNGKFDFNLMLTTCQYELAIVTDWCKSCKVDHVLYKTDSEDTYPLLINNEV